MLQDSFLILLFHHCGVEAKLNGSSVE